MAKDIDMFLDGITEYINTYIVGTENTCITECTRTDMVANRGHMIPLKVKVPGHLKGGLSDMGPVFYAEELMNEHPGSTVAFIAEWINVQVAGWYPGFLRMVAAQAQAMEKTLDDYGASDIIITAMPTSQVPEKCRGGFIMKDIPELGLTVSMKAAMCENPGNSRQTYFVPVSGKEGQDVTDAEWERAETNSIRYSEFHVTVIPVPSQEGRDIPVCGEILDRLEFYDYFYLLGGDRIWGGIMENLGAERVYIIPEGAHCAKFVADGPAIRECDTAKALRDLFLEDVIKDMSGVMPVFVFDSGTGKVSRFEGGGVNP